MTDLNHQAWYETPIANYLCEQEACLFEEAISNLFGFYAIQIEGLKYDFLHFARIPYKVVAGQSAVAPEGDGSTQIHTVKCMSTQLPWQASSIDLVLLPHTLDFSDDPHQTLRETERVLVPEGHLVISGFNPFSFWGAKKRVNRSLQFPWQGEFISLLRIKDWLALLGFEIVSIKMACFAPPLNNQRWLSRFQCMDKASPHWWLMPGGVYFIVAKKRVVGMRVIRPNWNASKLKTSLVSVPSQKQPSQKENTQKKYYAKRFTDC